MPARQVVKPSNIASNIAELDFRDNLHVYPNPDWCPHALTPHCTCGAQVFRVNGVTLIVHHSFARAIVWESKELTDRSQ